MSQPLKPALNSAADAPPGHATTTPATTAVVPVAPAVSPPIGLPLHDDTDAVISVPSNIHRGRPWAATAPKLRRGRRRGSGPYSVTDTPLLKEMHSLIADKERPRTRYAAALEVSHKAEGSKYGDSIARRLERKYKAQYDIE